MNQQPFGNDMKVSSSVMAFMITGRLITVGVVLGGNEYRAWI